MLTAMSEALQTFNTTHWGNTLGIVGKGTINTLELVVPVNIPCLMPVLSQILLLAGTKLAHSYSYTVYKPR